MHIDGAVVESPSAGESEVVRKIGQAIAHEPYSPLELLKLMRQH